MNKFFIIWHIVLDIEINLILHEGNFIENFPS